MGHQPDSVATSTPALQTLGECVLLVVWSLHCSRDPWEGDVWGGEQPLLQLDPALVQGGS